MHPKDEMKSNDGHQNKANSDATETDLDSNSKQTGKESVTKVKDDKDQE